jgi:hypothetical protein
MRRRTCELREPAEQLLELQTRRALFLGLPCCGEPVEKVASAAGAIRSGTSVRATARARAARAEIEK